MKDWWPRLTDQARQWLTEHPGDALSLTMTHEIVECGGVVGLDIRCADGRNEMTDFYLSEEIQRWIGKLPEGEHQPKR